VHPTQPVEIFGNFSSPSVPGINDLDSSLVSSVQKFADNTKLIGAVDDDTLIVKCYRGIYIIYVSRLKRGRCPL